MDELRRNLVSLTLRVVIVCILIFCLTPQFIQPAHSAPAGTLTLLVDTIDDNGSLSACADATAGDCSLRGAINHANADIDNGYIISIPAHTYLLSGAAGDNANASGDLDILNPQVELHGAGMLQTIIDGHHLDRVIQDLAYEGNLTISDLIIQNGSLSTGNGGGAGLQALFSVINLHLDHVKLYGNTVTGVNINDDRGGALLVGSFVTVNIDHSLIQHNQACTGGGVLAMNVTLGIHDSVFDDNRATCPSGTSGGLLIADAGLTTIDGSSFLNNTASFGGALFNSGTMTITDSTFAYNNATNGAGALGLYGTTTLMNVTLNDNSATNYAGAIVVEASPSTLTMQNVTIANNSANVGGAIEIKSGGTLSMNHITLAGNMSFGQSIYAFENGHVSVANSILSDSNPTPSVTVCYIANPANWTSQGYNLSNDTSCNLVETGDQTGIDPLLGSLGNFGGITATMPLLAGSPAIDHANPTGCSSADQRWHYRPIDGDSTPGAICDIGSFEYYPFGSWLPLVLK